MNLENRARAANAMLALALAFNPGQRRGPDGRWIKMGGRGSAGKSAPARGRGRASGGSNYSARVSALEKRLASGFEESERINPSIARTRLGDGSQVITRERQYVMQQTPWFKGNDWSPDDVLNADTLAGPLAAALGVKAPAVVRGKIPGQYREEDAVFQELIEGKTGAQAFPDGMPDAALLATDPAIRMGLFDVLTNSGDRHSGNWMVDSGGDLVSIDHGNSFWDIPEKQPTSLAWTSPFGNAHFIGRDGKPLESNPLTPRDIEKARAALEGMRPQFEQLDRPQWLANALARLDSIAPYATGTRDIL